MWKHLLFLSIIIHSTTSIDVTFECHKDSTFNEENYCWISGLTSSNDEVTVTASSFKVIDNKKSISIIVLGNDSYPQHFPKYLTQYLTGISGFMYDDTPLKYIQRSDFTALASDNELILHLRNNQIEELPFDVFYDLINLLYLDISSNKIKSLPSNLLFMAVGLHSLSISSNDLTDIHQDMLKNCPKIYDLTAEFNSIEELPEKLFLNNPGIKYISMMYNKLRNIKVDFRTLRELQFADFRKNDGSCDVIYSILEPDDKNFDEIDQRKAMTVVTKFQKRIEKVCRE